MNAFPNMPTEWTKGAEICTVEGSERMNTPKSTPTAHTPASDIEVLSIKPVSRCGNLKAFVDIRIGALEIHGLRVVQQLGQRAYVSLPVVEYTRRDDGQRAFAPLIRIHDPVLDVAIRQAVLDAWHHQTCRQGPNGW